MRASTLSETGSIRQKNEDALYSSPKHGFFAVADGMGGHDSGEIASAVAIEIIRIELEDLEDVTPGKMVAAFAAANKAIYEKSAIKGKQSSMGTTLSVFKVLGDRGYIGHIGDSRIYLIRNQEIIRLTEDHTYVERLYQDGIITYDEYLHHPKRNILLKALGGDRPPEPQVLEFQLLPGDQVFMCTDGVHNYLNHDEIISILLQKKGKAMLKAFRETIESRGSGDNYSIIAIDRI